MEKRRIKVKALKSLTLQKKLKGTVSKPNQKKKEQMKPKKTKSKKKNKNTSN